jgi:homoserine O-acetyltransferase
MYPGLIQRLILLASGARQTPWAIAFSESMRLAMSADKTFTSGDPEGGKDGLKAARSIALISYRTRDAYNETQKEEGDEKLSSFKAASYQAYQGEKLVKRFNPYSYWCLTCLSDTHNIGRDRGGITEALKRIKARVLCVGIKSDLLFPTDDQKFITANVSGAEYVEMDSFYGHDGFLIETKTVTRIISDFWLKTLNISSNDKRKVKDRNVRLWLRRAGIA